MKISLKSKNLEITESLHEYLETKLSPLTKLIAKWEAANEALLECELARTTRHHNKGDQVYYAEANLDLGFKLVRGEVYSDDPRRAIDNLKDILHRELKKLKDKLAD